MRPSFVVSLLLLSLLLTKAQGIRLGKGSLKAQQQKQHDEESALLKRSNSDADQIAILCRDELQCTGKIMNRKLVTTSVSTTKHRDLPQEQYSDLVEDIAEMDYSPAKRKPPIHN